MDQKTRNPQLEVKVKSLLDARGLTQNGIAVPAVTRQPNPSTSSSLPQPGLGIPWH